MFYQMQIFKCIFTNKIGSCPRFFLSFGINAGPCIFSMLVEIHIEARRVSPFKVTDNGRVE